MYIKTFLVMYNISANSVTNTSIPLTDTSINFVPYLQAIIMILYKLRNRFYMQNTCDKFITYMHMYVILITETNNLLGEYAGTATVDTICACEGGVDIGTGRNVPLLV